MPSNRSRALDRTPAFSWRSKRSWCAFAAAVSLVLTAAVGDDDGASTKPAAPQAPAAKPDELASRLASTGSPKGEAPTDLTARNPESIKKAVEETPIARAVKVVEKCRETFRKVDDYTCTFYKRERIDGKLQPMYVMTMKMRNRPRSIYFKFHQPNAGREAIYVEGRNDGNILAHDVGFTKILAGTMNLDPHGARAMDGCRHPITHAGIGSLIETVYERWSTELDGREAVVSFDHAMQLADRRCLLVEAVHPQKSPQYFFHKVRLFVDDQLGIPVRFEAYDWPKAPGAAPELVEEYVYENIKVNVGLSDADFDAANHLYSFGRF